MPRKERNRPDKWLSCRYFSLAKRCNIIIIIVRICETNVANENCLTSSFHFDSGYTNTKNILPRKRSVVEIKMGIVYGICQHDNDHHIIHNTKWMNEWVKEWMERERDFFQPLFSVCTAQKRFKQNTHAFTKKNEIHTFSQRNILIMACAKWTCTKIVETNVKCPLSLDNRRPFEAQFYFLSRFFFSLWHFHSDVSQCWCDMKIVHWPMNMLYLGWQ